MGTVLVALQAMANEVTLVQLEGGWGTRTRPESEEDIAEKAVAMALEGCRAADGVLRDALRASAAQLSLQLQEEQE